MMATVEDFSPEPEANSMLDLDLAHKAFEKVQAEMIEAAQAAQRKVYEQYNPLYYQAQSVLYEAMAKASQAGFSDNDLIQTMNCTAH